MARISSLPEGKPLNENEKPKGRNPGLRGVQTTMLFRAVNPELFIKPVRASYNTKHQTVICLPSLACVLSVATRSVAPASKRSLWS
uniref:Uncharacterized protein n=1 Tax=Anas platyrhynchos platyrhynchos TaxID=8840 RepID=A0A493TPZ9_ANAPP